MFKLAWRNIWRKRGRSLMTAAAVGAVVLMTISYFGLVGSMENGIYARLTQTVGHIQIHSKAYRDLRDFSELLLRNASSLQEQLHSTSVNGNLELVSSLQVPGLLEGEGRSRGVILMGIEQPLSNRERFIKRSLSEGTMPDTGDLEGIALGNNLAKALKVGLGDTVYMYAPGTEGYGAAAYTVSGLLNLGDPIIEARMAYVSLAAAQELAAPDAVGHFEVHLPDYPRKTDDVNVPLIRDALQTKLGDAYSVETWREVDPSLATYLDLITPATTIFTAIFFILAGLLVTNTVYLSLIERVKEFGVIMAVGASKRKVMGMVLSESMLLCFSGAIVGVLLGLLIVALMSQGFSIPVSAEQLELYESMGIPRVLYGSISPLQILITLGFTVAIGLLAAILPALTAARLEPVEAMRFTA